MKDSVRMKQARLDGLYLFLLGCTLFVFIGIEVEHAADWAMIDFKALYYPSKTFLEHGDPYNPADVTRVLQREGLVTTGAPEIQDWVQAHFFYPPSIFVVSLPAAMLPFKWSHLVWMGLSLASILAAAFLMWNTDCTRSSPALAGGFVALLLLNSELVVAGGNVAEIAIALTIVSTWCFLEERCSALGVWCLALSLMLKPHEGGVILLFLLTASSKLRKRALQSLVLAGLLCLPLALAVNQMCPSWIHEVRDRLTHLAVQGGGNDPGPTGIGWPTTMIHLPTLVSMWKNDPAFYNAVSDVVGGGLLLLLIFKTVQGKTSYGKTWSAMAVLAPLTLLAIYHRRYDSLLLLLSVPACVALWSVAKRIGLAALALTTFAYFFSGDNYWFVARYIVHRIQTHNAALADRLRAPILIFPAPLSLLLMTAFFLWIYLFEPHNVVPCELEPTAEGEIQPA